MLPHFIVLDGPDGSGTTLHARLLAERLHKEGHDVVLTAEPSDSLIGQSIRKALSTDVGFSPAAMQLLFCADRAEHVETVIKPALAAGKIVVCDRYVPSTIIYGEVLGLDADWLEDVNAPFPVPDVTIFTLPPFAVCRERLERRKEHDPYEESTFAQKVYECYEKYAAEDGTVAVVDTSAEKAVAAERVYAELGMKN